MPWTRIAGGFAGSGGAGGASKCESAATMAAVSCTAELLTRDLTMATPGDVSVTVMSHQCRRELQSHPGAAVVANLEVGSFQNYLDEIEEVLEWWEECVTLHFALHDGEIQVG